MLSVFKLILGRSLSCAWLVAQLATVVLNIAFCDYDMNMNSSAFVTAITDQYSRALVAVLRLTKTYGYGPCLDEECPAFRPQPQATGRWILARSTLSWGPVL